MPGVSTGHPKHAESRPAASGPSGEPWEHATALASFPVVDDRKLPSRGHNPPYWSGMVRVSPSLDVAYRNLGPDTAITVGSIAVEQPQLSDGNPGPVFVVDEREPGLESARRRLGVPGARRRRQGREPRRAAPLRALPRRRTLRSASFGPRVSSRRRVGTGGDGPKEAGRRTRTRRPPPRAKLPRAPSPARSRTRREEERLASSRGRDGGGGAVRRRAPVTITRRAGAAERRRGRPRRRAVDRPVKRPLAGIVLHRQIVATHRPHRGATVRLLRRAEHLDRAHLEHWAAHPCRPGTFRARERTET